LPGPLTPGLQESLVRLGTALLPGSWNLVNPGKVTGGTIQAAAGSALGRIVQRSCVHDHYRNKPLTRLLRGQALVDEFLLRTPVVGRCLRALALTRFCLALRLTLETGMPIAKALRLSFRATGNAAFTARLDKATALVKL